LSWYGVTFDDDGTTAAHGEGLKNALAKLAGDDGQVGQDESQLVNRFSARSQDEPFSVFKPAASGANEEAAPGEISSEVRLTT
jgi:hypothetical protein